MSENIPDTVISQSLSFYLNDLKTQISSQQKKWNIYKKYTNTFEYIDSTVPNKKTSVSKYKPISRSYFKMVELFAEFHFGLDDSRPIRTFHLAEGPGGFIEAVVNHRKHKLSFNIKKTEFDCSNEGNTLNNDMHVGMTLIKPNETTATKDAPPGWRQSRLFFKNNTNIFIETGADKTGNILSLENLMHVNEIYGNSMDFITADGGFDFSGDFNRQEISVATLLYGQIVFALCLQKTGGSFVIKIFDCFMAHTVDLLLLLSSLYEEVYITKPHTSRCANSEKYVVCKNFTQTSSKLYPYLFFSFKEMLEKIGNSDGNVYMDRFLSLPIPHFFLQKLEKYNGIFGQMQMENIEKTLSLIEETDRTVVSGSNTYTRRQHFHSHNYTQYIDKNKCSIQHNRNISNMVNENVDKCIHWCIKHNVPM
jgi:23S rRNA U2552 (ribose-2'-O)-methylase RlmE/FtsJ